MATNSLSGGSVSAVALTFIKSAALSQCVKLLSPLSDKHWHLKISLNTDSTNHWQQFYASKEDQLEQDNDHAPRTFVAVGLHLFTCLSSKPSIQFYSRTEIKPEPGWAAPHFLHMCIHAYSRTITRNVTELRMLTVEWLMQDEIRCSNTLDLRWSCI